jgi:hypothetical protein
MIRKSFRGMMQDLKIHKDPKEHSHSVFINSIQVAAISDNLIFIDGSAATSLTQAIIAIASRFIEMRSPL